MIGRAVPAPGTSIVTSPELDRLHTRLLLISVGLTVLGAAVHWAMAAVDELAERAAAEQLAATAAPTSTEAE